MPASRDQPERHDEGGAIHVVCRFGGGRIVAQFAQQADQHRIAAHLDLMSEAGEQMRAPLGKIGGARRHPRRMQRQSQHVDRRLQQRRIDTCEQARVAAFDAISVQWRSTASAGYGSCPAST